MRCANGSSPSGRHRPPSRRQPFPIRLPVKPTASTAEDLPAKKFCFAPILPGVRHQVSSSSLPRGPLSFARIAETLSLPADLAPPGDIAIARENFRLCFSIVTCRGNSNPDVGGVIGFELLLREIDWTGSWSADLG